MTTAYFQSVIEELNKNCEKKHLPANLWYNGDKSLVDQRIEWEKEDIYMDDIGTIFCKDTCHMRVCTDENQFQWSWHLCETCKNIMSTRVTEFFDTSNATLEIMELKSELYLMKNEVKALKELVAKLLEKNLNNLN